MRTGEPVYKIALAALDANVIPVLIPGDIEDHRVVHIHGFPVDHFPIARFGTDVERVCMLITMAYVARRYARQAGMRLTGGPA